MSRVSRVLGRAGDTNFVSGPLTGPLRRVTMEQLVRELVTALEQADLYLNSYDTSAPSRIKAETRAAVESAIGLAKASVPAAVLNPQPVAAADLSRILGKPRRSRPAPAHNPAFCGQCAEEKYR